MTLNEALKAAGIETVRDTSTKYSDGVYLKYDGKVIPRPIAHKCKAIVAREFGIILPKEA